MLLLILQWLIVMKHKASNTDFLVCLLVFNQKTFAQIPTFGESNNVIA